ncbi:hypothetical protein BACI349Y_660004 [Bacillus sp. 349Y]|nr:hypothetical protein BACI349Y_660004 [Bacillus sp. 349Y]
MFITQKTTSDIKPYYPYPSLSKNTIDEPLSLINFYGFSPGTSNLLTVMPNVPAVTKSV